MKKCTCCGLVKPLSEFYLRPDRGPSAVLSKCKVCSCALRNSTRNDADLAKAREWKRANKVKVAEHKRAWAKTEKGKAYYRESSSKWRSSNLETARARVLVSRQKKQDYYKARQSEWSKNNPAKRNAKYKRYVATRMKAMPSWANSFFIEEVYDLAQLRTKATGIEWQVDHIVPLQSRIVCGLHAEHNLRVVPASVNRSKSNRHWPDMAEAA